MKVSRRLRTISDYAFEKCPTRGIISYSGTEEQWQEIARGIDNLFIRISEVQYGIAGDADGDGKVSVKDAVAVQKWLLHMSGAKLRDCDLADLDENGIINIYDFCLLKRKLLHQK